MEEGNLELIESLVRAKANVEQEGSAGSALSLAREAEQSAAILGTYGSLEIGVHMTGRGMCSSCVICVCCAPPGRSSEILIWWWWWWWMVEMIRKRARNNGE